MRVLLLEPDLEDAAFLTEALAELEEQQHGDAWIHAETSHAVDLPEALALLACARFDVILLAPMLPGGLPLQHLRRIAAAAPDTPVIAIASSAQESLASRMVREGAQDFLLKNEVDCRPLLRSIRNSIERHRALVALRSDVFVDPLTRVYNSFGFCALARRDLRLAGAAGWSVLLVTAQLEGLERAPGAGESALLLTEFADSLRCAAGETDLVGRLDAYRFAVLLLDRNAAEVVRTLHRIEEIAATRNAQGAKLVTLRVDRFSAPDASLVDAVLETILSAGRQRAVA